jgi:Domain of unknown function (DUF4340)
MRISRTTVVLLVANLIAFALMWKATYSHQPIVSSQAQLFPAEPVKVTIVDGAERLVLEKRNSFWRVSEPFEWPANIWSVQRLLDELRFISADNGFAASEVKANGSSLEAYGLAAPKFTLRVAGENGQAVEVKVGVQPSTRHHFLLADGGQRIIPLPEAMAAALTSKAESYRVDKIFEIADFETRTVSVRQKNSDGESVTALTNEARPRPGRKTQLPEWRFESPYDALADADTATKVIAELTNLRASKFAAVTDEASGLSAPTLRIALEGNSRRQVLLIGKALVGQPNLLCAKLEENASIFLIEAHLLRDWFRIRETLAASHPADFDPALVTGFTIAVSGRSITLHRLDGTSEDARWEIPVAPGTTATKRREADTRLVTRFLDAVSKLSASRRKTADGDSVPAVLNQSNPGTTSLQSLELEFGAERILLTFSDDPEKGSGTRVVHAKGSPLAAICDTSLLNGGHQNVDPQAWRKRTVAELSQGAKVSGLRLISHPDGKVLGEARLGPDGSWAGSGRLDPANARRVAVGLADVKAAEFPGRDVGSGGWKFALRVTDQAATGGAAASETFRTYLCSAPFNKRSVLLRDEGDDDEFILETGLAEILIPLLTEAGR